MLLVTKFDSSGEDFAPVLDDLITSIKKYCCGGFQNLTNIIQPAFVKFLPAENTN